MAYLLKSNRGRQIVVVEVPFEILGHRGSNLRMVIMKALNGLLGLPFGVENSLGVYYYWMLLLLLVWDSYIPLSFYILDLVTLDVRWNNFLLFFSRLTCHPIASYMWQLLLSVDELTLLGLKPASLLVETDRVHRGCHWHWLEAGSPRYVHRHCMLSLNVYCGTPIKTAVGHKLLKVREIVPNTLTRRLALLYTTL